MKALRLTLILVMIVAGSTVHAKKTQLKYKLEAGMEFTFQQTLKQEIGQEVMGQTQIIENLLVSRHRFKVVEINEDGNYLMEDMLVGNKMLMENDFIKINYDSDSVSEPQEGLEFMSETLNVAIKFTLSEKGEIEIIDASEYLDIIKKNMGKAEGQMQQMLSGMALQSSSVEGVKNQLAAFFFQYPDSKLKVGESWSDEAESTQMVRFNNLVENTLVEADKSSATIKQSVEIEQLQMDGMEMDGMKINYELGGVKNGAYHLDLETGLIKHVESLTDISGIISIESPQLASPTSIPMTIKNTEKVELIN